MIKLNLFILLIIAISLSMDAFSLSLAYGTLDIDKKNIIHIGDSIKADYIGARKAGISSILIGRKNRIGRLIR